MSLIFEAGLPFTIIRSACLPTAIEPMRESSPRNLAPLKRGDLDGFDWREACFDQQFDFAQIAEAGDYAAVAGWVEAGEQKASGGHEGAFEVHRFAHQIGVAANQRRCVSARSGNARGLRCSSRSACAGSGLRWLRRSPFGPACAEASGALASNTGRVEVTATFFATSVLIVCCTASLLISSLRSACETAAPGHLSGCLLANEFGIGKDAMLEIVYADLSGFAEAD